MRWYLRIAVEAQDNEIRVLRFCAEPLRDARTIERCFSAFPEAQQPDTVALGTAASYL